MKLLIAGCPDISNEAIQRIQSLGHSIIIIQDERVPLRQQGIDSSSIEGVICNGLFLYNDIADFSSLRYIQLISAGYDRVPLSTIEARGIQIHNARGVYDIPMSEWVLCGVLQLYKRALTLRAKQKRRLWEKERNIVELCGKTVCIVGCGSVGGSCARLFGALGCKVIGVNRTPRADSSYSHIYGLDEIGIALESSDIVIFALPAVQSSFHILNAQLIKSCKASAVIVNVGRGTVIDSQALVSALQNGNIAGAVIDVFESEPLSPHSPLWTLENVILTPHNSFIGEGNRMRLETKFIENLQNYGFTQGAHRE